MTEQNLNPDAVRSAVIKVYGDTPTDSRPSDFEGYATNYDYAVKVTTDIVSAYLSALPAQPDTVSTRDEVKALPEGTIVMDAEPCVLRLSTEDGFWYVPGSDFPYEPEAVDLPATVLYRPVEG